MFCSFQHYLKKLIEENPDNSFIQSFIPLVTKLITQLGISKNKVTAEEMINILEIGPNTANFEPEWKNIFMSHAVYLSDHYATLFKKYYKPKSPARKKTASPHRHGKK